MSKGPVLVTGSSSGIGREITEFLSSRGHVVYATARKAEDLASLATLAHVVPFALEVTDPASVEALGNRIREEGNGLYGLVNNAGVASFGPLVETPAEEVQRVLDVNLLGAHRLTSACFPFLRASHGRVVNITSVEGFLTPVLDGAYVISKHALEAYTDILRDELSPFGIRVSAIEPGGFQSKLLINLVAGKGPEFLQSFHDSPYREMIEQAVGVEMESEGGLELSKRPSPRPVAEAVEDALYSRTPRVRYLVARSGDRGEVFDRVQSWMDQLRAEPAIPVAGD